jgi:predicted transcriptional regulator
VGPSRAYRSKIEVLRDFLMAASEPIPKTRLIGTANLNPGSFQRYLRICTERELITTISGGYVTTPKARPLLAAIDGLMSTTGQIEHAFRVLGSNGEPVGFAPSRDPGQETTFGPNGVASRHVLRQAWNEIVLRPPPRRRAEPAVGPPETPATSDAALRLNAAPPALPRSRRTLSPSAAVRGARPRAPRRHPRRKLRPTALRRT